MLNHLFKYRMGLVSCLICLLTACNVKSDDIEMRTMAKLNVGCEYWHQCKYDSAMVAFNEAIVLAKSSENPELLEKVQQTIVEMQSDIDSSERLMRYFIRRRKLVNFLIMAVSLSIVLVTFLIYRSTQKRKKLNEMNLNLEALQNECETLSDTNRDNLFRKTAMIYKIFLIGENKDIDKNTFQKLKSCVCGRDINSAYDAIYDAYNKVYPDVVQSIKANNPPLTETEFKICILSLLPFSVKEVADIMKVSVSMIGKTRTAIRRKSDFI